MLTRQTGEVNVYMYNYNVIGHKIVNNLIVNLYIFNYICLNGLLSFFTIFRKITLYATGNIINTLYLYSIIVCIFFIHYLLYTYLPPIFFTGGYFIWQKRQKCKNDILQLISSYYSYIHSVFLCGETVSNSLTGHHSRCHKCWLDWKPI